MAKELTVADYVDVAESAIAHHASVEEFAKVMMDPWMAYGAKLQRETIESLLKTVQLRQTTPGASRLAEAETIAKRVRKEKP